MTIALLLIIAVFLGVLVHTQAPHFFPRLLSRSWIVLKWIGLLMCFIVVFLYLENPDLLENKEQQGPYFVAFIICFVAIVYWIGVAFEKVTDKSAGDGFIWLLIIGFGVFLVITLVAVAYHYFTGQHLLS